MVCSFSVVQPSRLAGGGSTVKDALYKKSVPLRAELLQRAGKFLGKEIGGGALFQRGPPPTPHPLNRFDWWGGCASGVPLGEKILWKR